MTGCDDAQMRPEQSLAAGLERARGLPLFGRALHLGTAVPRDAARRARRRFRTRVSGDAEGTPDWVRAIGTVGEGPGWFEPGGVVWAVHGDVSTLVGGITALLGQGAHPLALAGVERHSSYRDDPWKRLAGTARWLIVTTFGSAELAESEAARVRGLHVQVAGTLEDGRAYAASDPDLLRWVHLAFTDAFLHAQQHLGGDLRPRFGPCWQDRYVGDWARSAVALGATDLPTDAAGLDEAIRAVRDELEPVPDALRAYLHAPPGLGLAERPFYATLTRVAGRLLHPALAPLARVPGRASLAARPARLEVAAVRAELVGLKVVLGGRSPSEQAARSRLARPAGGVPQGRPGTFAP